MDEQQQNVKVIKSRIGGQALIEGVMMRGLTHTAMAVRKPDGTIDVSKEAIHTSNALRIAGKIPIVRGVVMFVQSIVTGYRYLAKSAEISGMAEEEEEPESKFEQWLTKVFGEHLMKVLMGTSMVLGLALCILLFILAPAFIVKGIDMLVPLGWTKSLLEGIIKMAIFIGYLAVVSRMKEMKRVFQYHGAEHKSIFCYENGLPLTVENVRKQKRFHPRCGTSFMILILIISIVVSSVVTWDNMLIRVLLKIITLPLIMGIGYELIKLAGRYDNIITRIISWPGMCMQHLTTSEPDDSQIEVAIASLEPVLPTNREEDQW